MALIIFSLDLLPLPITYVSLKSAPSPAKPPVTLMLSGRFSLKPFTSSDPFTPRPSDKKKHV
jgi:hypothetical protein